MKGEVDFVSYKVILYRGGDLSNAIDLTKYIRQHTSEQEIELENDNFSLDFNLIYEYKTVLGQEILAHQFVDTQTGGMIFAKNDLVRVFVKQNEEVDINSRSDLLAEYFLKDFSLSSQARAISLNFVNINYSIYNRLWSGTYGRVAGGTSTNISGNTLTDSSASFSTNSLVWKTLSLQDIDGNYYNYLITSNTATEITVHRNIDSSVTPSYIVGDSSPSTLAEALQRVTPYISFNGNYNLSIIRNPTYQGNGICFLRNDNYAFPVIDYTQNRKPYHKLIAELSSVNAINTETEIQLNDLTYLRDMVFSVKYDTEENKYRADWYYPEPTTKYSQGVVTSVLSDTLITNQTYTTNELKGKLLRIRNKSYNILSNTTDSITLSTSSLLTTVQISDSYVVLNNVDFIWDSEEDWRNIYEVDLNNKVDDEITHIYFSCGTNKLNNREIVGHLLKEGATVINETSLPLTYIAKFVLIGDGRLQPDGTYTYPSYPHTIKNDKGQPLIGAEEVNSDGEYNISFRKVCREIAYAKCRAVFGRITQNSLKGNITIRGNKYITAGLAENVSKTYHKGTQILFKDTRNGWYNPNHSEGYYIFKVQKIKHTIDNTGWETNLEVSYDVYDNSELSQNLSYN